MSGARDPKAMSVTIGGVEFGGWQEVEVSRGVERMPSNFEVTLTERYPNQTGRVVIQAGQACVVRLGDDVVITGYVDTYSPSVSPGSHSVQITGRGRCQDLTDCSAGFDQNGATGGQVSNATAAQIAARMAKPFGITVTDTVADPGKMIPQFNIIFGETVFEIIDRCARYSARIVYEDTAGNLVLAQVGTVKAASGFEEGVNIQSSSCSFSMMERFSDYFATILGTDTVSDSATEGGNDGFSVGHETDAGVPRFRPMVIVSAEMQQGNLFIANLRAKWEKARRYGRSQAVHLTCDNWRDQGGVLWTPNTLATVKIPSLKLDATWVISEVSFRRGENGTTADVTLMPPEAFQPEPAVIQSYDWQIAQVPQGGAEVPVTDVTRS